VIYGEKNTDNSDDNYKIYYSDDEADEYDDYYEYPSSVCNYHYAPNYPPKYDDEDMKIVNKINALYGVDEVGYDELGKDLIGHKCITDDEIINLKNQNIDPLYGEITLKGLHTLSTKYCMDLYDASVVYDLGAGCGKLLLMIYMLFPNIKNLIGYEISESRYNIAVEAYKKYSELKHKNISPIENIFTDPTSDRTITLKMMSIFDISQEELQKADKIFLAVNFLNDEPIMKLYDNMKNGTRILTFRNHNKCPCLKQIHFYLPVRTTWSCPWGHIFHFYEKIPI